MGLDAAVEAVCGTIETEATCRLEASYPVGFQLQSRSVVQLTVDRCDEPIALGIMISLLTVCKFSGDTSLRVSVCGVSFGF